MENITTHEPDIVNENIISDLVSDFDGFLKKRDFANCEVVVDNLRDLKQYSLGIELAKRLTARKMTVPSDYGDVFKKTPAEKNFLEGVRRKKALGIIREDQIF